MPKFNLLVDNEIISQQIVLNYQNFQSFAHILRDNYISGNRELFNSKKNITQQKKCRGTSFASAEGSFLRSEGQNYEWKGVFSDLQILKNGN